MKIEFPISLHRKSLCKYTCSCLFIYLLMPILSLLIKAGCELNTFTSRNFDP